MRILTVPNDTATLRTKSSPIYEITLDLVNFLRDLGETLKSQRDPQGVGLSAIQVGRPIRVFAMWLPSVLKGPTLRQGRTLSELRFFLNPEILDHSPETTLGEDLVEANRKQKTENNERKLKTSSPTPYSLPPKPFLEGCLSIPRIYGPVPRWEWIKTRATVLSESDLSSPNLSLVALRLLESERPRSRRPESFEAKACRLSLEKLASRVFQHELDHLNGILFTDRTLEAGLTLYRQKEKELVEMEM